MFCFIPTASAAATPDSPARAVARRGPCLKRSTAASPSQKLVTTNGMPSSSPLVPAGSISPVALRAAASTATQAAPRRTAAGSATPAWRSTWRAVAAAATTIRAHATAPTTRRKEGPPIRSESLTSAIIVGGRATQ